MNLDSYKPGSFASQKEVDDPGFNIKCWSCSKSFLVFIGIDTMHFHIYNCPHCKEDCEIE
jgi:hypothetical protein